MVDPNAPYYFERACYYAFQQDPQVANLSQYDLCMSITMTVKDGITTLVDWRIPNVPTPTLADLEQIDRETAYNWYMARALR